MERLYKALVRLASVAIVLGASIAFLYWIEATHDLPQGLLGSRAGGFQPGLLNVLSGQIALFIAEVAGVLGYGAIMLGATLAWANQRRGWLVALIVVTLLTLLLAPAFLTWVQVNPFGTTVEYSGLSFVDIYNIVAVAVPLIPVALALIFALIRRKPAAATTTDAELGIVRSAL